ncbi:MAG: hypothetical protein MUC84_02060 [Solirubrobacteraceae bacterium]|nr:hypothetical protein [Solirubrobacteraceae bacterium]
MATPEPDWEAEGLLAGLDEPARAARVTLLGELHAEGTRLDELRAAVAEGRLAALPAEHVLGGPIRHSARDGATRNGLPRRPASRSSAGSRPSRSRSPRA